MLITAGFSLFVLAHLCRKVYLAASPKVFISLVLALLFALVQVTLYEEGSLRDGEIVDVISFVGRITRLDFFQAMTRVVHPFL
jgi:hypothetical protein